MRPAPWKVGELAKWTGVTVRTLHYYDEIGLLRPSRTTEAGYRLYTEGDVIRLQQIQSLAQNGILPGRDQELLARPEVSPDQVLRMQIGHLRGADRAAAAPVRAAGSDRGRWRKDGPIPTEEFLQVIEVTNMMDKYYSPEQSRSSRQRREALGEDRIRQVQSDSKGLMDEVRAEMDKGTDPASETVQALARRWTASSRSSPAATPASPRLRAGCGRKSPRWQAWPQGPVREMMEYVGRARAAGRKS